MSDRGEFEKRNPVPEGAIWCDRKQGYYCVSSASVTHPFNDMWECFCDGWQAARAQDQADHFRDAGNMVSKDGKPVACVTDLGLGSDRVVQWYVDPLPDGTLLYADNRERSDEH